MLDDIRVLLVDDENAFTSVLAKRLSRRGLSVATASGGGEAYALLENSIFDVVVLDMVMPDIDGMQLFKAIRQRFDARVIFLTGKAGVQEAVEVFSAGAFDCLFKGTSMDTLVCRIQDAARAAREDNKAVLAV